LIECQRLLIVAVIRLSGEKTGATIDWTTLRGVEGNCGLLTALCALHRNLYPLAHAGSLRRCDRREALVLGLLAWLAALGFILQTLVVKKDLLAASPGKILPAVNALNRAILELHFRMAPLSVRRTRYFSL
jgi:hypothetical protein